MFRRLRASQRWNGPAASLKTRVYVFVLGAFAYGIWLTLRAVWEGAPAPVEWLGIVGFGLILFSLLPESDPDPVPPEVATSADEETTWADWLQIAFNLVVVAMFVASIVLLRVNHRHSVRLFVATVGAGLVCALVNHIRNGPPYPSD